MISALFALLLGLASESGATPAAPGSPDFPSPGPPPPLRLPIPEEQHLPGGAPSWRVEVPGSPTATLVLTLRHGTALDPDPTALRRAQELIETRGPRGADLPGRLRRASAQLDVEANPWQTRLVLRAVAGRQGEALAALREILTRPQVAGRDVRRRARVEGAARRSAWRAPALVHQAAMGQLLYPPGHPLRPPPPFEHVSAGRVEAAWSRLARAPAALVQVGGLPFSPVIEALGPLLAGGWISGDDPPPPWLAPTRGATVLVDQIGAERALIGLALPLPGRALDAEPALELLLRALVLDFDGRLHRRLRVEGGLVYALDGRIEVFADHGWLRIGTSCAVSDLGEVLTLLLEDLAALPSRPLSADERRAAQASLRRDLAGLLLSDEALARFLAERQGLGRPLAAAWEPARAALEADAEDLARAALRLDPAAARVIISADEPFADASLMAAGLRWDQLRTPREVLPPGR